MGHNVVFLTKNSDLEWDECYRKGMEVGADSGT